MSNFLSYFTPKVETRDANCGCESSYSPFADALLFGSYGKKNAMGLSAFFAATNLISNSLGLLPVIVGQEKDGARNVLQNHKIAQLFYNMRMTKFNVIKMLVTDIILKGNAFMYVKRDQVGEPVGLTYLRPGQVTVEYNELKDEVRYQVTTNNNVTKKVIPEQDMIHLFMYSNNGYSGQSILSYGSRVIDLSNSSESAAADYFDSGCNIKGMLQFDSRVPDEQKAKIRANWSQVHGQGGSGLAVLEGASKYIPVSQNTKDSQMVETRMFNITEIARLFNINPVLLGDLSHSSYNDIEAASQEFLLHTLLPWIEMMENQFNKKLMTRHRNQYIAMDENVLLRAKKNDQANYLKTLVDGGIMTRNEARHELDLNAMEGCDELVIPYTNIADNTIGGDSETEPEQPETEPEDSSVINK